MRGIWGLGALLGASMLAIALPGMALADDPNDPAMATRAARERDRAMIRKLNEDQLAYVRKRDARYARGWDDYRRANGDRGTDEAYEASRDDDNDYASARSEYESAMAQWRRDVADCRAGYYEHCRQR